MKVQDLFSLNGKSAIVTGGSAGIGFQIAQALGEAGANLVVCSRNAARCDQAANELRKLGINVLATRVDVTDADEVKTMAFATQERFGRIDILVNNAGGAYAAPPEKMSLDDWKRIIDLNLTGAFNCAQQVGRNMIRNGGGNIINIASVVAYRGTDDGILDAISYNTSKGALISFTKDLAVKWAKYNIRVNAIAPGFFPTHLTEWVIAHRKEKILSRVPMGRLGGSDDLKGAVVFLASGASDYVTGHVLDVDGGMASYL